MTRYTSSISASAGLSSTAFLPRMLAVAFDAYQIIDDVDCAGDHTEHEECGGYTQKRLQDKKLSIEHEWGEHEKQIFRPLARRHGADEAENCLQVVLPVGIT